MLYPIDDLLDETACYELLLSVLHPTGLRCPKGHELPADQAPHDRHRAPVFDFRCRTCGKVFNVFTGTALHGVRHRPGRLVLILRGFCQGATTLHLAEELDISRRHLLTFRHRVQGLSLERFSPSALDDEVTEADEMYQNAGEKGRRHPDPDDPPRRRGNQFNGHGTFENDRPPIPGVIGRDSGQVFLRQTYRSTKTALEPVVLRVTRAGANVHTDEWHAYADLDDRDRVHHSVNHKRKEWARDDDGDGIREVHTNTIEGHWLGLRNYLRPFRGVSKWCLDLYLAFYQGMHNFRRDFLGFLRQLFGPITPNSS